MNAITYTRSALKKINNQIKSLNLPIVAFTHDITDALGRFAMLTSALKISQFYQEQHIPLNCLDSNNRRIMQEGFHTTQMLIKNHSDRCLSINKFFEISASSHNLHYYKKVNDSIDHLYTFSFFCSETEFQEIILNKQNDLLRFIDHHNLLNDNLIANAFVDNNFIFHMPVMTVEKDDSKKIYFNSKTNLTLLLTRKQRICINYLTQGLAAKEIANQLNLSHRTIQHHLEEIRQKNSFASLKELLLSIKILDT